MKASARLNDTPDNSEEGSAPTIQALAETLREYLTPEQTNLVRRAYYYAEQAHDGQFRRSGEPYATHPLAVACILAEMRIDHQSLMAAMLHDVIEDTGIEKHALATQFTPTVAELVDGVSKLNKIEFQSRAEAQAENFQKMALAMAQDIRVILVKLADRLHNVRTLWVLRPEKRRRIARETLDIYAPIANRLGINAIKVELEERCFAALYPMRHRCIKAAVDAVRGNRKALIDNIQGSIQRRMMEEDLAAIITGREKHLYGIYQKMRQKRKSFSEIMDVFAVRIVVDSVDDCYRTLGIIHGMFKPHPGQFKDYIAIPKSNGYQSLHTVLAGNQGVPIEAQIRTHEMQEMANKGIAAHWLYKTEEHSIKGSHLRAQQWVQGLLEMQKRADNPMEFIEHVKVDLFPDEVYVFTPQGKLLSLPNGATAVDFAYAVHTDVGHHCAACRIDRNPAPLSDPLQNGQTIEIITSEYANPNPAWLNYVVTGKARSHIRHHLKHQRHTESVALGQEMLDKALCSFGGGFDKLKKRQIKQLLKQTGHDNLEQVLKEIGLGNRVAFLTAKNLLDKHKEQDVSQNKGQLPLLIAGAEGMVVKFAKCCHPIPGDHITGYLSTGRGLVVHRDSCQNIADNRGNRQKQIELQWSQHVEGEFDVEIRLELQNKRGIFALIANEINELEANIEKISTTEKDSTYSSVELQLSVRDRAHLAHIMRRIRATSGVSKVIRPK
jgi:guanosine-3',5'-bis(diphosphate) 3'-pyrophosphohydrolase